MRLKRFNESLTNVGKLKNAVQVMNWIDIESNNELRDIIMDQYGDNLNGSDTYVRYYPYDNDEFFMSDEIRSKINEYLYDNGFFIDNNDEYFYILIRIDW